MSVSVVELFPVLKVLKKYVAGNIGLSLIRLKNPGSEFKLLVWFSKNLKTSLDKIEIMKFFVTSISQT